MPNTRSTRKVISLASGLVCFFFPLVFVTLFPELFFVVVCFLVVPVRFFEGIGGGVVGNPFDRLGGPGLNDGLSSVDAESPVDESDRAPGPVVARAEDADELRVVVG